MISKAKTYQLLFSDLLARGKHCVECTLSLSRDLCGALEPLDSALLIVFDSGAPCGTVFWLLCLLCCLEWLQAGRFINFFFSLSEYQKLTSAHFAQFKSCANCGFREFSCYLGSVAIIFEAIFIKQD